MTLRAQNRCENCSYTWYPRGKDVSLSCPRCSGRDVRIVRTSPAVALAVLGVALLVWICGQVGAGQPEPKAVAPPPVAERVVMTSPRPPAPDAGPAPKRRRPRIRYVDGDWKKLSVDARRKRAERLTWEEVNAIPAADLLDEEMERWSELKTQIMGIEGDDEP